MRLNVDGGLVSLATGPSRKTPQPAAPCVTDGSVTGFTLTVAKGWGLEATIRLVAGPLSLRVRTAPNVVALSRTVPHAWEVRGACVT